MEYFQKGDIIQLGWKRRTFWEWLTKQPIQPQFYTVMETNNEPDSVVPLQTIENNNIAAEKHAV